MADKAFVRILKQDGVTVWNKVRPTTNFVPLDFRGADLTAASLIGADLSRVDLQGADLTRANLTGADLSMANLIAANFHHAILDRAQFRFSNLSGADLSETEMEETNFMGARLTGANFTDCLMGQTWLADIDLSACKGVDTIRHHNPSNICIDVIYQSRGNIPEAFLRGAGVPESFIANMKSLVAAMEPIEFYSCFISYSNKDQEFAERLHADLRSKNVRCWFAPEDLKIGDRLRPSFDEAIRVHDKLMVLLSESSVRSEWVEKEVETAFEKERREKRTVLFPIRLDDAVMETDEAWAADIRRTRHIGDFRDWKNHDSYKKAFDRLLRNLKAL